ncbi:HAMP domain-containing sensor histidine kinase [Clostridium sp.]|uniref:sensor histidine kinase n=1 Tax=Clostridium sp. TaxID=1506 RepID=UPI003217710F
MITSFKNILNKWLHNFNESFILVEFLLIFIIGITALPEFINTTLIDYDGYTNKRSVYGLSILNESKFKNEMLQNDTIEFRESLLSFTDGFSKIIHCENDESAKTFQNYMITSLSGKVGVLLIDKVNNRWFSNRNWFNDYPFNQLPPDEALIKLSKEDDVLIYNSNNLSHYSTPYGYYNGAYTPPIADLEEIYFIRGTEYSNMAKFIKYKFYLSVPLLIIFIMLIMKQILCIKTISIHCYLRKFNTLLPVRAIKGINIFFTNAKYIFKNLFFDSTLIMLLIFWIVYLPLCFIFNLNNYDFNLNDRTAFLLIVGTIFIIITNTNVRYLENINNKQKLIKYLQKIEDGDIDIDINSKKLGTLSDLASEINTLKISYKKKIEDGLKNERLKTELITNVSHDLKTPLTSIVNYVDILKDETLEKDEIKDYVTILDNKSNKLKKLVEDLFEMSKMNSGQIILNRTDIDIVELIHQSLGELTFLGEDSNLTFKVIGESSCLANVDGARMSRVMDNLICNAIKYSLENSRVYLQVSKTNEYCEIVVKNISKYDLDFNEEEILERFVRGDKSRNSNIEGSGLGLAITNTIVELHGGTLKVKCDGDLFKVIIRLPFHNDK